uniref:WH1 domain-containing protein n=1 Tax=Parastrongyloides trichosuri TaxID=131310 RepID=A0A0N5A4Y1_PARTI
MRNTNIMIEDKERIILCDSNNEKILHVMGHHLQLLAYGMAEVLQPDFYLKTWTLIQSGVVCFVMDNLKRKYYLNVYKILNDSENTQMLLNMEISKRLSPCMKTSNFVTFCDSLDHNDYLGVNFVSCDEAKTFYQNCNEIQKKRSSKFKFFSSRNNSSISLTSQTSDICQSLSSSSSISSTSLNDPISKFKKLWNINPIRLFKRKAFSKCDSFTVTPNSSFKEEIEEFKERIVESNINQNDSSNSYSKTQSPIPTPVRNMVPQVLSKKGISRSSIRNSRKSPKSLLNARNSIKVNRNKIHQRTTLCTIKTLKIQRKISNTTSNIEEKIVNNIDKDDKTNVSNNIPKAPPLPPNINNYKIKNNTPESNVIKNDNEIKIFKKNHHMSNELMNEIKNMDMNNLRKVEKCENKVSINNSTTSDKLSVMDILRKNIPVRRNACDPEDTDDDGDSAWSSSNYHSDSDF